MQNYKNHTRIDPAFHLVGAPLALAAIVGSVVLTVSKLTWPAVLLLVLSLALGVAYGRLRRYATQLQDRIIRAEENFRHFVLTGSPLDPRLTPQQIVALRFAGDDEFADLCRRAAETNMKMDEIKRAVRSWRADSFRV